MVSARFECYLGSYLHIMYYDFKLTFPIRCFMYLTTITTSHAGYLNGTSAPADTKTRILDALPYKAIAKSIAGTYVGFVRQKGFAIPDTPVREWNVEGDPRRARRG